MLKKNALDELALLFKQILRFIGEGVGVTNINSNIMISIKIDINS